jgi:hypothetical protein
MYKHGTMLNYTQCQHCSSEASRKNKQVTKWTTIVMWKDTKKYALRKSAGERGRSKPLKGEGLNVKSNSWNRKIMKLLMCWNFNFETGRLNHYNKLNNHMSVSGMQSLNTAQNQLSLQYQNVKPQHYKKSSKFTVPECEGSLLQETEKLTLWM